MNKAANVKITNELKNPSVPGTHYRLLCMTGPGKGKVYYLTGKRILIGRGDNADIQIVDTKISREHAELSFSDGGYTITDLGTQNGIIVNDSKVTQKRLADTEKVVIGQTVFKYSIIEVSDSEMIVVDEENSEAPKDSSKTLKAKIKSASKSNTADPFESSTSKAPKEKKGPSKMIIIGVVALGVIYMMLDGGDQSKNAGGTRGASSVNDIDKDFSQAPPKKADVDPESKKKLETLIHSGRREFSEGNYFRAMEDFRLALLLNPNDGHASFYLSKAKQSLDDDIRKNFEKGKQEHESKKLQAAIVSYCGVIQLIQNYPNDERYKNAMLQISAIESELGMEKGEIKCLEEKSADPKN